MGIREDIRSALGTIAAAVPEAVRTMRHGEGECGAVVQSTSREFADPVSESGPAEAARFVASGADFPTLDEGAAVELDGSLRVVTSLRSDPVGATLSVGLSAAFDRCPAAYRGVRRDGGTSHRVSRTVEILCIRAAAEPPDIGDAPSISLFQSWLVCIAADAWLDVAPPQTADSIEFVDPRSGWETVRLRVASVVRHGGWWMLKARPRGGS